MTRRHYIGLSSTFHDPAIAIIAPDGRTLFAEATERYLQDKRGFNSNPDHLMRAPRLIAEFCGPDAELVLCTSWSETVLRNLQLDVLGDVTPLRSLLQPLQGLLLSRQDHLIWPFPRWGGMRQAMLSAQSMAGSGLLSSRLVEKPVRVDRLDHHATHAYFACLASPMEEATCAVVDGYGELSSSAAFTYRGGRIEPVVSGRRLLSFRAGSLGMFYSQICNLCGFDSLKGEEWKVMGLAPYGKVDPRMQEIMAPMICSVGLRIEQGCSDTEYRRRLDALRTYSRPAGAPVLDSADMARTGQAAFEDVMRTHLCALHRAAPSDNLVLTGGCALNSAWNGKIVGETPFRRVFVPSAPGDDGNAIGAAWMSWMRDHPGQRPNAGTPASRGPGSALSPYLGTDIPAKAVDRLEGHSGFRHVRRLGAAVAKEVAAILARGGIVGWMQGRAEYGPRALGNRSILADPRNPEMKARINARVKFREAFRPFAPSILHERGPEWFDAYAFAPYMERALLFRPEKRDLVPAVVHADGTGRVQSVTREASPEYHALISAFEELTGVPILLNTSFNVMGKPIIHSVEDACGVFMTSGLDALVIGDLLIEKETT